MPYKELYQILLQNHLVAPIYVPKKKPPYPSWYNPNAHCEYHAGAVGHDIENCISFKRNVQQSNKLKTLTVWDEPGTTCCHQSFAKPYWASYKYDRHWEQTWSKGKHRGCKDANVLGLASINLGWVTQCNRKIRRQSLQLLWLPHSCRSYLTNMYGV